MNGPFVEIMRIENDSPIILQAPQQATGPHPPLGRTALHAIVDHVGRGKPARNPAPIEARPAAYLPVAAAKRGRSKDKCEAADLPHPAHDLNVCGHLRAYQPLTGGTEKRDDPDNRATVQLPLGRAIQMERPHGKAPCTRGQDVPGSSGTRADRATKAIPPSPHVQCNDFFRLQSQTVGLIRSDPKDVCRTRSMSSIYELD